MRLVVESGVDKGMIFPLVQDVTTLGRSAQNHIQIIDKRMSRHHVEFHKRGGQTILRDLGSKNGTWINQNRVTGDNPLSSGDRVRVGETVMLFELEAEDLNKAKALPQNDVKMVQEDWAAKANPSSTMVAGASPMSIDQIVSSSKSASPRARDNMALLLQVGDAIRNILDLDELLAKIMDVMVNAVKPDIGVLFLVDDKTNRFYPCVSRDTRERGPDPSDSQKDLTVSRTIIDRCAQERISILVSDGEQDARFNASESLIMHRIKSAICAPIIYKETVLGVVYISSATFQSFTREDQELITGIANQAAMAISNVRMYNQLVMQQKLEKEMEIARTIQMNLLPKEYPELANFELSALSLPAKQVGGDYYDFIKQTDGRVALVIADVSGKGVPAALLTTTVRAAMQTLAQTSSLPTTQLVGAVNAMTTRDSLNNMFVTMVYAAVDNDNRRVEFINAGHAHPVLFSPDGTDRPLIKGGSFLGIDMEMEFESETLDLPVGSVLILYTDGVTDTTDDHEQQFGVERFKRTVRENLSKSADDIRDAIYEATLAFRGTVPQFDDFTLLVLKCVR